MWNDYELPTTAEIDGREFEIRSDYRAILDIIQALNDPDLLDEEKMQVGLEIFYPEYDQIKDLKTALDLMMLFINANNEDDKRAAHKKPLMSWEQDLPIIIAPINKVLGKEVRDLEYLHWWTFISAFMEIGECTFNTYVGIRDKLNRNKKLEKYEEQVLKDNRNKVILKKKVDSATQSLLDEILGY